MLSKLAGATPDLTNGLAISWPGLHERLGMSLTTGLPVTEQTQQGGYVLLLQSAHLPIRPPAVHG